MQRLEYKLLKTPQNAPNNATSRQKVQKLSGEGAQPLPRLYPQ